MKQDRDSNAQSSGSGSDSDGFGPDAALVIELERLRKHAIVQSRELAAVRWEINALLRRQALTASGLNKVKSSLRHWFPKFIDLLAQFKHAALGKWAALRRAHAGKMVPGAEIAVASDLCVRAPILILDDGPAALAVAAAAGALNVVRLDSGAGRTNALPVAPEGHPTLRPADSGSLADLLVNEPERLRSFNTLVVDSGDEVSLGLLRGRLTEHQGLLLTHTSGATALTIRELGSPVQAGGMSYYARLPADWLDPLDAEIKPISSVVAARRWPKISVVMVSFNQAAYLEEGINSILGQCYPNLEYLVIDAVSKDGSIEILERYRERLDLLLIEADRGQADGLNKGFSRSTGDILTWVNSDDLLEPGALFRVGQAFMANPVDLVVGGCRQIGLTRSVIVRNHHTKLPYGIPVALPLGLLLEMDRFWLTASFFYQPEVFFSREIWNRCGGRLRVDLNYIIDYDLWVRMAAAGATILHIPDFLACSRTHEQQKTTVGMPYLPEVQRVLQEYASRLVQPPPLP